MFDGGQLFDTRRSEFWQRAIRYLRLIGNSGFLFSLYLLFVFGSYYYGQLLNWLPDTFPAAVVTGVVFVWFLTRGRVRTFTHQADMVFLTPVEHHMPKYIRRALGYSWLMESFYTALVVLLFTPLMMDRFVDSTGSWLLIMAAILLLKGWNLLAGFEEQRFQDDLMVYRHTAMRFVINGVVIVALFDSQTWLMVILSGLLLLAVYGFYFRKLSDTYRLKWHRLLDVEERTTMTFYRIANSFTDVPGMTAKVKSRRYMDIFLSFIRYAPDQMYHYILGRSLVRANDYFGIYLRLTVLGIVFVTAVHLNWGQWLTAGAFVVLSGMQLNTLKDHYDTSQMIELYPVKRQKQFEGHLFWMRGLLLTQAVLFAAAGWISADWLQGLIILLVATLSALWLSDVHLKKSYTKKFEELKKT
ncbi:ABC transporter permease [Salisediminibacterium beveridgei]|uniref:ABC transporter, permease protein EscB n=1 Tax=Salisediminibacterium beveridgei TaxID=632773 RepID=A0A1D7QTW4_9BACI|nr:ABC transporter permease [Salisediminibacterium beveridgei]AOM82462.1 ABC transporter, permease protein EscB [Salisediminibacterium beveridgei]